MDGAGAGIGGNGGAGGTSLSSRNGTTGESGENCGEVNIYNDIAVYAFGGGGGTGGAVTKGGMYQSGGGGSGFPAARNRSADGAGGTSGNTYMPGGGFGCGCGEYIFANGAINGCTLADEQYFDTSIAGSYYESFACFDFTTYKNYDEFAGERLQYLEWSKSLWDYQRHLSYDVYKGGKSGGIAGGAVEGSRGGRK